MICFVVVVVDTNCHPTNEKRNNNNNYYYSYGENVYIFEKKIYVLSLLFFRFLWFASRSNIDLQLRCGRAPLRRSFESFRKVRPKAKNVRKKKTSSEQ